MEEVESFKYLGVPFKSKRGPGAKVDNLWRVQKAMAALERKKALLNPAYGMPVAVGLKLVRSVVWSAVQYGLDLGYPSWKEMEDLEYKCLQTILGTPTSVSRAKMMKYLGWIPVKKFWAFGVLRFALRLIRQYHPSIKWFRTRVLSKMVITSQWLVVARKAAALVNCVEEWKAVEQSFSVVDSGQIHDTSIILLKKLREIKNGYVKDLSLKYGHVYSVFSFIFFSGRFNPPWVEKVEGVPSCYFCGADGGDNPVHLIFHCQDEFVNEVITDVVTESGLELDYVRRLLIFFVDWRVGDNGGPISRELAIRLSRVHCTLYRARKNLRNVQRR